MRTPVTHIQTKTNTHTYHSAELKWAGKQHTKKGVSETFCTCLFVEEEKQWRPENEVLTSSSDFLLAFIKN